MTTSTLDPSDVMSRGSVAFSTLGALERLVFLLIEFETLMDMEGWDDFFTSAWSENYSELKSGLQLVGDYLSIEVLQDYEDHLKVKGVSLERNTLDSFLSSQDDSYFRSCRDWRESFAALSNTRWAKVKEYLSAQNVTLLV